MDFDRDEISEVVYEAAFRLHGLPWIADQAHAEAMDAVDALFALSDDISPRELADLVVTILGSYAYSP